MAKILILIGAHLCTAPRPQKEAMTLADAGHDVMVRGVWFDPELAERDRLLIKDQRWQFAPVLDFRPHHALTRSLVRIQAKLARKRFQHFKQFSPALLGYGAKAMLKAALLEQADLTIVHSEAGLWVGDRLLDRGLRVGVDFEDWFSQDLLPEAQITRPIAEIKQREARLAKACTYCLTTSHALAETLACVYQTAKPTVIYNVFPRHIGAASAKSNRDMRPSLHWFSQTIGRGRGLEILFQALRLLKTQVDIHLRGHCSDDNRRWLEASVPEAWCSHLFIHPTVSNDELPSCIAQYDIGLALEQFDPPSRNLTVTNKLFQYMQAGLAVIATETAGQREILSQCPDIGRLVPCNNPLALAEAIDALASQPEALQRAKTAAFQAAQEQFCWESQRDRLLQAADLALAS
jgi:glycosyltransferase involved in cell wall biosynthesis